MKFRGGGVAAGESVVMELLISIGTFSWLTTSKDCDRFVFRIFAKQTRSESITSNVLSGKLLVCRLKKAERKLGVRVTF